MFLKWYTYIQYLEACIYGNMNIIVPPHPGMILHQPFLVFIVILFIYIYSTYRYYRRYSGIISNRRCFLGVRPNAFQIEDIAECKSSSNDQKSKNKPLNIGMIFGISSIWKSFVPLLFFVFFAGKLSKINRTLTPGPGGPPEEESAKVPPEVGPGRRYFGTLAFAGGVGEKLFKNHGFLSFFDWRMVIQTTFQIEDNL